MELLVRNSCPPGRRLPISRSRARALIRQLLEIEGVRPRCEISLVFCDEEEIRRLNRDYLGDDSVTDVLSFPQETAPAPPGETPLLGDVVICTPLAARQAKAAGRSTREEVEW